jgi:transketolase
MDDFILNDKLFSKPEMMATRDGFGDGVFELAKKDKRVVVLTADLKESTRMERFANAFPARFIECGVAEQNMMGMAAGLAASGKIPVVASYAVFSPGRNWDQLRVAVCYSNLPVIIGGSHTGLSAGPYGTTHQALEDMALARVLPNMTVIAPCDYWETIKAVGAAPAVAGPVYIRFSREQSAVITKKESPFAIGRAEKIWSKGKDVAIVGCGPIIYEAIKAAEELAATGINVTVINNQTIKPIDRETIVEVVRECGAVVTAEEHQIAGGMGSAVCELLAQHWPVPIEMIGMRDHFGESGTPEELAEKYGMKAGNIVQAVKKVMERKEYQG